MLSQWLAYVPWRPAFYEVLDQEPKLYTIEYLDGLVITGTARFWSGDRAAIIAQIKVYPSGAKSVHGLIAAGQIDQVLELIPQAEAWGKSQGAIGAEIESRLGWARALKGDGYSPMQLKLWKDLI